MHQIAAADHRVLLWISGLAGKFAPLDYIMRLVVNDYFVIVSISLVLLGLWFWGKKRDEREYNQRAVMVAAASLGISDGMVKICNLFYYRPRPFISMPELLPTVEKIFYPPHDASFPSNAAAIVFAAAVTIWFYHHKIGAFLCFLALLMSFARVYAAVHYPLDIIGGAVISILISLFCMKILFPLAEPIPTLALKLLRKLCIV